MMNIKRIIPSLGTKKRVIGASWGSCVLAMLGILGLFWPLTSHAAQMVGHRALYSLEAGSFDDGSNFDGASGKMELSMERNCDGWTMSQSLKMNLQLVSGGELQQFHRYTGRENHDGTQYDFFSSSQAGDTRDDFRGQAVMERPRGAGNAEFRIPQGKKIPLPQGTRFPLGHTAFLIDRAMAGDRMVNATVFDGGDDTGPQQVTAFIGKKIPARDVIGKKRAKALGPLVDRSGWKMRMAFYKLDSQKAEPEYEVEALQLDNGVTPWLLLDYHDFSVILKMIKIEEIPPPKC